MPKSPNTIPPLKPHSPPNMASFIDTSDDVSGVKLIPGHIESFSGQGSYTKIDMASGRTWYVPLPVEEVDAAIKSWYTRVSV